MYRATYEKRVLGGTLRGITLTPDQADPDGALIVYLHEGLGSVAQWKDFPEALCALTGLMGFAYERHGHCESERAARPHDHRFFREEVESVLPELLKDFPDRQIILCGHSDGATIALYHASLLPDRVLAVIAMAPHVFTEPVTAAGVETIEERFVSGPLRSRLQPYHSVDVDAMFARYRDIWRDPSILEWNMFDLLARIECPALLLQGEEDEYGTARQLTEIRDRSRGPVSIRLIPHCRHIPYAQARDATLDACSTFIREVLHR
jgi:pimeloyl-ACP methyl ester carboxylesterase